MSLALEKSYSGRMSSSDRFPAGLDDIPITATVATESVGTGTRYVFTALHRYEADFETRKTSGFVRAPRSPSINSWHTVITMK